MVCAGLPRRRFGITVLNSFVPFAVGTIIVLFFQCMITLFGPVYRRGVGVKWGLVIVSRWRLYPPR